MKAIVAVNPTACDFLRAAQTRGREQLQDILQIGELTGCIARLAHMLQRERGASNIWLCSSGRMFGDEHLRCIAGVDRELALFRQAIADSWPASIDDSIAKKDWGLTYEFGITEMTKDMLKNLKIKLNAN